MPRLILRKPNNILSDLEYFELLDRHFKKVDILDDTEFGLGEKSAFIMGKSH